MADTDFIGKAIGIIKEAIAADNAKDYPKALNLYDRALEHFIIGLKYEQNESKKRMLEEKVIGYMNRAEELKKVVRGGSVVSSATGGGGGAAMAPKDGKKDGGETEESKRKDGLSGAIVKEKPNVKWSDVAGLEGAKDALKEAVILPVKFPQLFTGKRKPWRGILLYGPPGTGKSYLAKAVATEAESTFYSVSSSDLVSKWQGESEKLVRNLFEMAREAAPSIIFIDEIDSLTSARADGESDSARRIKTEFLVQMQGVGKGDDGVLVLGATNTPWGLDPAMRRRFDKRVYIPLPEAPARGRMFEIHLGSTPNDLTTADFAELGRLADGFSGSDIAVVVREALFEPLRKCQQAKFFKKDREGKFSPVMKYPSCSNCIPDLSTAPAPKRAACPSCGACRVDLMDLESHELSVPDVCMDDFRHVLEGAAKSVAPEELTRFIKWTEEFGEEGS